MGILPRTQFGNPLLRRQARQLDAAEIKSPAVQFLVRDMRHTLAEEDLGIALAAPQVGKSIALAVIAIRPLPHRPKVKPFDLVLINPKIIELAGKKLPLWEGCISAGSDGQAGLFAQVPRFNQVKVKYYDENGVLRHRTFKGLKAQAVQHEIDHLNGILFVDRVSDPNTFMTYQEYIKRVKGKPAAR